MSTVGLEEEINPLVEAAVLTGYEEGCWDRYVARARLWWVSQEAIGEL